MTNTSILHPIPDRARVRVVTTDTLGNFVDQALRFRPRAVTIVSPWLGGGLGTAVTDLRRLVRHVSGHSARVHVITRPSGNIGHEEFLCEVRSYARSRISFDPLLHAKLYVCESTNGGGVALVGSANFTDSASGLHEVGVLVTSDRNSKVIQRMGRAASKFASNERKRYR